MNDSGAEHISGCESHFTAWNVTAHMHLVFLSTVVLPVYTRRGRFNITSGAVEY